MESALAPHGDQAYPPYNIEKTGEATYRISVAVAGFGEEELDVTVKENTLTISGKTKRDEQTESKREYFYRGIAGRTFRLAFALADAVQVKGAGLENGLLHVAWRMVVVIIEAARRPRTRCAGRGQAAPHRDCLGRAAQGHRRKGGLTPTHPRGPNEKGAPLGPLPPAGKAGLK